MHSFEGDIPKFPNQFVQVRKLRCPCGRPGADLTGLHVGTQSPIVCGRRGGFLGLCCHRELSEGKKALSEPLEPQKFLRYAGEDEGEQTGPGRRTRSDCSGAEEGEGFGGEGGRKCLQSLKGGRIFLLLQKFLRFAGEDQGERTGAGRRNRLDCARVKEGNGFGGEGVRKCLQSLKGRCVSSLLLGRWST